MKERSLSQLPSTTGHCRVVAIRGVLKIRIARNSVASVAVIQLLLLAGLATDADWDITDFLIVKVRSLRVESLNFQSIVFQSIIFQT